MVVAGVLHYWRAAERMSVAVKTRRVVGPNSKSVRPLAGVAVVDRIVVAAVVAVRVAMTSAAVATMTMAMVIGLAATVTRGITTLIVSTGILGVRVKPSRPQAKRDVVALRRQAR